VEHHIAGSVSREAVDLIAQLFGRAGRPGIEMAKRALRLALPEPEVEALCVAYTQALTRAMRRSAD
jgi:replicative superfamily II helicase